MELLQKLNDRLERKSRLLGIGMTVLVLAVACWFSRENFWEMAVGKSEKETGRLVVIDAGHGGDDPGKIGVDGTQEKDLNLMIAKKLQVLLEQQDLKVVMTREEDQGLYDEKTSNKKIQDMKRRCEIINKEQPSCVVSIHQNSYHEESIHGAQVFYYGTSLESQKLAEAIQEELIDFVEPENHRKAKANESYYLLKKTEVPVVIVECGFLSNWEESGKLKEDAYQDKLAWAIHLGVLRFMNAK